MFIIEKSIVLISLGMCNWFTLRQEINICLDYFIWKQSHLHLLDQANLLLPCCAGLNFLSCGVIDIMIMMIRAVKANSNSLLSAEENFGIKQDSELFFVMINMQLLLV